MFGNSCLNAAILTIVLFCAGCGASYSMQDGVEPNIILNFDDGFEMSETIEKDEYVALTMRSPEKKGHMIIGASFDPDILSLVRFHDYEEDGEERKAYLFRAVQNGLTDVVVKMRSEATGITEVYKRARIKVGERSGFLF